jgi:hypothetical protein
MRGWMLTAAVLLAACGADADANGGGATDTAQAASSLDVPPPPAGTTADSAIAAEAAKEGTSSSAAAPDTGYTAWRSLELPSEPWMQRAATPAALLQKVRDVVAAQLEEPDASVLPARMENEAADVAVGLLVHPDQADDSVRDVEFRLHMRNEGAEWAVVGVDRRERCRRGVADGGLCA